MAGLTCAQSLREGGLSVALLEKSFCGSGASGKSSGFITPASELELSDLLARFGRERGSRLWAFAEGGVDVIRSNIAAFGIMCDHQSQDSLFVAVDDHGARRAEAEHIARAALGYPSTSYLKEDLKAVLGTDSYEAGVRYPGTFGIDSYGYCRAMKDVLVERGVLVFEDTPVTEVRSGEVRAAGHTISTGQVIVCADRGIPDIAPLKNPIGQVQTFLAISKPLGDHQLRRVFPSAPMMVWDSKVTYNYFRLTGEQRLLAGGANLRHVYARHERHDPVRNLRPLAEFVSRTFPGLEVSWDHVWPGMLGVSKDFLPVAGPDTKRPFLTYIGAATGLPWAAALGRQVGRSIASGKLDTLPEFSPYRHAVRGGLLNHILTRQGALALAHGLLLARNRK
jgi:gamma-glutamylputrescine oxidase